MAPTLTSAAIGRSLRQYHGDPHRLARMTSFYAQFLGPGDLAFDIGAHVGDRTRAFRALDACVVALEPQPAALRALRLVTRGDAGVTLLGAAVGARTEHATLFLNTENPTVSTLSTRFVAAAKGAAGWLGQEWTGQVDVPVTTLDALISAHGVPAFVKIDVEGHEDAVLDGLSDALPALSFEMTTIDRPAALRALDRVASLGNYRFALSLGEAFRFDTGWEDPRAMARGIETLPHDANSGDVYARRIDP